MRVVSVVAVCALLLSANVSAQETGWVAPASGTAVVRGRVVAAADGRPLARARVTLTPKSGNPRSVVAGEHGAFEFTELPAGRYDLKANLSGYLTSGLGQVQPSDKSKAIVIKDGEIRTDLELALPAGGVIEVRVTDETGVPVEGAFVQAQRARTGGEGRLLLAATIGDKQRNFGTDDQGVIRLYDLEPGPYYVSATPAVVLGQPGDAASLKATGRLQTFHPGVVTQSDAEPVVLGLGEEIHLDVVIRKPFTAVRKEPNGAITVHVIDDAGNPRAGVEVRALEVTGEGEGRTLTRAKSAATSSPQFWQKKDFYTDDRGDARIYGLPLGEYVVSAAPLLGSVVDPERSDRELTYVPIYFPGSPSRADAQALAIRPWDDVSLQLALTPARAAQISGRVVRWDGDPGRAFVTLNWNPAAPLYPQGLISQAFLRAEVVNGEFTFYNVAPGDYIIRTSYDPDSHERDGDAEIVVTLEGQDVSDLVLRTTPTR